MGDLRSSQLLGDGGSLKVRERPWKEVISDGYQVAGAGDTDRD
jgi:hypothetical protein